MTRRTPEEKKVRQERKAQICATHSANGNWRELAASLGVPQATAYRWVKLGYSVDKRGGVFNSKVLDVHREYMVSLIEGNYLITLKAIVDSLWTKFSLRVSKQTVRRQLDGKCYTLKNVRFEPEKANEPENKVKRRDFVEKLLRYESDSWPIVFMDETNFNIHISRTEGRSLRGTRCSTLAAGSKGANIHVIGAISTLGVVHYEIRRGAFKKSDVHDWMRRCLRKAMEKHGEPEVLVIDNAPCHTGIEDVFNELEFSENKLLRLGPYSPMLNPIENVWSMVKSDVKRELAEKRESVLQSDTGGLSISEFRARALTGFIKTAMDGINPETCIRCIANIQGKVGQAMRDEDMEL